MSSVESLNKIDFSGLLEGDARMHDVVFIILDHNWEEQEVKAHKFLLSLVSQACSVPRIRSILVHGSGSVWILTRIRI